MKIPELFRPNQKLDNKVIDLLSDKPKFNAYNDTYDDDLYEEVIYSSIVPEDLEKLKVGEEKFFNARLELNHEGKAYQIVFEPYLSAQECRTVIYFIELDKSRDKKSLLSLIERFIDYNNRQGHRNEEDIKLRLTVAGNNALYALTNFSSYYSPRAIANFTRKFAEDCLICNITFRKVTGKELKGYNIPKDKIVSKTQK